MQQNICFLYHLVGGGTGDWDGPVGGMGAVTEALAVAAAGYGAEIVTGADVYTIDQDGEVSERLAQRAQEACEELALDRDLDDVDFDEARARGDETVEIDLRARV